MSQSQAFEVIGGRTLSGELQPQGAKNEALQIISAVLLTSDPVEISNIPDIIDIRMLIDLLKGLGVKVELLGKGHYNSRQTISISSNLNLKNSRQTVARSGEV